MDKEKHLEETYTFRDANLSERYIRKDLWQQLCALTTDQLSHTSVQHNLQIVGLLVALALATPLGRVLRSRKGNPEAQGKGSWVKYACYSLSLKVLMF